MIMACRCGCLSDGYTLTSDDICWIIEAARGFGLGIDDVRLRKCVQSGYPKQELCVDVIFSDESDDPWMRYAAARDVTRSFEAAVRRHYCD
jgi:hypothetical protein